MNVKTAVLNGVILACSAALSAPQVIIDSLDGNGQLVVSAPSNSDFTVEWASSLTPFPDWKSDWVSLQHIQPSLGSTTLNVPMFFRVSCWTNGLLARVPIGRTLVFSVTNAYGEAWREEFSVIGQAMIPALSNRYFIFTSRELWSGAQPAGAEEDAEVGYARPTDESLFTAFPEFLLQEFEMWRRAEVGTTWTNFPGLADDITTIEAYEDVTVPAGVFTDCIRFYFRSGSETGLYAGTRFWVKPGFMEVQSIEYLNWGAPSDALPIVRVLESWSDD